MTKEEIAATGEKIKAGTATKEETLEFHKEVGKLLSEIKELLKE